MRDLMPGSGHGLITVRRHWPPDLLIIYHDSHDLPNWCTELRTKVRTSLLAWGVDPSKRSSFSSFAPQKCQFLAKKDRQEAMSQGQGGIMCLGQSYLGYKNLEETSVVASGLLKFGLGGDLGGALASPKKCFRHRSPPLQA